MRVRVVHRNEPSITPTRGGAYPATPSARQHIAQDIAADLVGLLSSDAVVEVREGGPAAKHREPIRPGHVAVLVRTHRNAALVRDALDAAGIPAVINGAGSVFGTVPARHWQRLLEAIERPASSTRARSAALTQFLGWTAERVACAGETQWEEVHQRLHRWARVLRTNGVAALMETITRGERLPGRVLATADGERDLTDLRHVGQLLHATATAEQMGAAALTAWLRQRIAAAARETGDEERTRRLESDAEAVQVLTIHRSKGLEFPIVYCPDLWEPGYIPRDRDAQPVFFHDPAQDDARTIDVGLDGPDWRRHRRHHEEEQRGEDLRVAYVALTRARHQAVVWWAGSYDSRHSALGRLLFARGDDGQVPPAGAATPTDTAAVARFEELAALVPGCISVERSRLGPPVTWSPTLTAAAELAAATFDRPLDVRWRRTSFSDISAGAYEASVASEPDDAESLDDEPPPSALAAGRASDSADAARFGAEVALAAMPVGLEVGTLVHRVLEAADFTAVDLDAEITARIAEGQGWRHVNLGDPDIAAAGLTAALRTPLGPMLDGMRLCDIGCADRLDELEFELPLAGGDEPTGRLTLAAIAAVLREHLLPGDPLHSYAARLDDPALRQSVRGYLTGSIDLVLRLRGDDGAARSAIADYKTNWLAGPGEQLTAWHHRPAALAVEMRHRHYGLQALLYTVALHRYLRWRLPGYDPERHIVGVLYLFLRGMTGSDTPAVDGAPCGVFAWRPPGALVQTLSDVFDHGQAR